MKGTILDFLKLATEKPELASELVALAKKYDFDFSDEVTDEELDGVAGGAAVKTVMSSLTGGGLPDGMVDPGASTPSAPVVPSPYPNTGGGSQDGGVDLNTDGGTGISGGVISSSKDIAS